MRHQAQKGFRDIFVVIPQHQKGYLVYTPITRKVISSYGFAFDKKKSSTLAYKSQPYSEAMAVRPAVTYTHDATYSKEKTGNIIMFAQFEEGDLLSENFDDAERGDESDDNSIMPPLIIEEEMDAMDSGDESEYEPMSTDMLEDIHDGSQSRSIFNRKEARYKIRDRIKQRQLEWRVGLKAM